MATLFPVDAALPPGPRPLLGGYVNVVKVVRDPVGEMGKLFRRYGPVASMASGGRVRLFSSLPVPGEVVFVHGPELLRYVSTQHSIYHRRQLLGPLTVQGQPSERQQALRYWGAGLFDINEEAHRRARRLMLPAFHKRRVETYRNEMVALTQAMLDGWVVDARRDVQADLIDLTMKIVTSTLFGVDPQRVGAQIGHAIQESFEIGFNPVTVLVQVDKPGFRYHRLLNLVNKTNATLRHIIATKRAQGDGGDVLSMLLAARDEDGSQLSEDELLSHATLLFMAGHETSSSSLAWTLFLLGQHPEVAADLVDELQATLGGTPPTVEQLRPDSGCLPLLDRVIKESMRVLPAVAWNARVAAQDDALGGYAIPANTEVLMSIYHTHHSPELYPLPERFDPRRWEGRDYGMYEYIPFSGGPRMCIGASFALMEIKIVLAMLLQRYRLEPLPGARIDRLVTATMGPRGLPMVVRRQDRNFAHGVGDVRGNVREMVALAG